MSSAPDWAATQLPELAPESEAKGSSPAAGEAEAEFLDKALALLERGRENVDFLPDRGTPDEDRLYQRLGWPEKPDGYDVKSVKIPDGLGPVDEGFETEMLSAAHRARLTGDQVRAVWEAFYAESRRLMDRGAEQRDTLGDAAELDLRQRWGEQYDARTENAARNFASILGESAAEVLDLRLASGGRLGDLPALVEAFDSLCGPDDLAAVMHEQSAGPSAAPAPMDAPKRRAWAEAEIRKLRADKSFTDALTDTRHPRHRDARERWNKLFELSD